MNDLIYTKTIEFYKNDWNGDAGDASAYATLREINDYIDNASMSKSERCEYCGTKIIGNHTHCKSCGAPL